MITLPAELSIHGNAPFAARQLAGYLQQITGHTPTMGGGGFPIHIQAGDGEGEGYRVDIDERAIHIEGESLRGAVYGVYDLLENDLGCAFFAPDCEFLPPCGAPIHVKPGTRTASPAFEYRDVYWRGALDGRFALKSRLNSARADIPPEWGGRVRFFNYSHTFDDLIPPDEYFDAHPEYFSLVDGQRLREKTQLCLTNPEVLTICIEGVRGWMRDNPDCRIFSVAQNDWYHYCTCEACAALDAHEDSHAGSMIHFVNQIAEAIEEEFPQNYLHTFAYLYTRKAPRFVRPRDNVIVRLCSIECCFSHPMAQCEYAVDDIDVYDTSARTFRRTEQLFARDLTTWSGICDHLYLWDYTTNFANYLQPFPNLHVLQPNLQMFRKQGVKGVFEQGNYAPGETSAFAALKIYLLGKLLWNPDADVGALTTAFLRGYYGKEAAPALQAYLNLMQSAAESGHMCLFDGADAAYLEDHTLAEGGALLQAALDATIDPMQRKRIEREALSPRYVQLVRLPLDAPGRDAQIDAFAADVRRLGVTELFERRELEASFACMKRSRYAADRAGIPYTVYRL